jgi:hypothetical protein
MGLINLLTEPESFNFYKGKGYPYGPREVSWDAGTPNNDGVMGNGAKSKPLITTPLPSLDTAQTPKTLIDSLYRGQGVLTRATIKDTERISKFLLTEQGIQFLAKEQALLITQNIRQYGSDVRRWSFINPASYVENTALAATGIHLRNTFTFGLNPSFSREGTYGEAASFKNKRELIIKKDQRVDKITVSPLYKSSTGPNESYLTDTVPFYITQINNDGSGNNTYIHFRAYISGLSDSFTSDWKSTKYMGRGEDFYSYNGFGREISFGLKVPVLSSLEQTSVYSKLNYLASLMAPDYTQNGFMRGNLVKLTIGDYITNLPGIIKGITFGVDDEAGWEVPYNDQGVRVNSTPSLQSLSATTPPPTGPVFDEDGNQIYNGYALPKLINIDSISFTPIHNFIPRTVSDSFVLPSYNAPTEIKGNQVDAPFITFGRNSGTNNNAGGYSNSQNSSQTNQ